MKSIVLDTNCLLSFLKNRNERQYHVMGSVFRRISDVELEGIITGHAVSELVFVMENVYHASRPQIHDVLTGLLDNPGVRFLEGYYIDLVLKLWPGHIKDYGDAIIASCAEKHGFEVMTFDEAFARSLKKCGIPIFTP